MKLGCLNWIVDNTQSSLEKYNVKWEKWSCTLMCDGWKDEKGGLLSNFLWIVYYKVNFKPN